jgi:hypothetical protein
VKKVKLRWLFPICHLVIDLAIVATSTYGALRFERERVFNGDRKRPFAEIGFQEDVPGFRFEPRFLPPPRGFILIVSGTLPAGAALSIVIMPEGDRGRFFKPLWLIVFESLALPIWFLLGLAAESRLSTRILVAVFLATRGLGVLMFALNSSEFWQFVQAYCWFALVIYFGVLGVRYLWRHRRRPYGRQDAGRGVRPPSEPD